MREKQNSGLLSEFLSSNPSAFDARKIQLVDRRVMEIDSVPVAYHDIRSLFLSGNYVSDLAGIVQFQQLQSLSLAYNNITDLSQVEYLVALRSLRSLRLEGNAIANLPQYRLYIIHYCTGLHTLDGVTITARERAEAMEFVPSVTAAVNSEGEASLGQDNTPDTGASAAAYNKDGTVRVVAADIEPCYRRSEEMCNIKVATTEFMSPSLISQAQNPSTANNSGAGRSSLTVCSPDALAIYTTPSARDPTAPIPEISTVLAATETMLSSAGLRELEAAAGRASSNSASSNRASHCEPLRDIDVHSQLPESSVDDAMGPVTLLRKDAQEHADRPDIDRPIIERAFSVLRFLQEEIALKDQQPPSTGPNDSSLLLSDQLMSLRDRKVSEMGTLASKLQTTERLLSHMVEEQSVSRAEHENMAKSIIDLRTNISSYERQLEKYEHDTACLKMRLTESQSLCLAIGHERDGLLADLFRTEQLGKARSIVERLRLRWAFDLFVTNVRGETAEKLLVQRLQKRVFGTCKRRVLQTLLQHASFAKYERIILQSTIRPRLLRQALLAWRRTTRISRGYRTTTETHDDAHCADQHYDEHILLAYFFRFLRSFCAAQRRQRLEHPLAIPSQTRLRTLERLRRASSTLSARTILATWHARVSALTSMQGFCAGLHEAATLRRCMHFWAHQYNKSVAVTRFIERKDREASLLLQREALLAMRSYLEAEADAESLFSAAATVSLRRPFTHWRLAASHAVQAKKDEHLADIYADVTSRLHSNRLLVRLALCAWRSRVMFQADLHFTCTILSKALRQWRGLLLARIRGRHADDSSALAAERVTSAQLRGGIADLEAKLRTAKGRITVLGKELGNTIMNQKSLIGKLKTLEATLEESRATERELRLEVQRHERAIAALSAKISDCNNYDTEKLEAECQEIASLREILRQEKDAKQALQCSAEDYRRKAARLEAEYADQSRLVDTQLSENRTLRTAIVQTEVERRTLMQDKADLEAELRVARDQVACIRKAPDARPARSLLPLATVQSPAVSKSGRARLTVKESVDDGGDTHPVQVQGPVRDAEHATAQLPAAGTSQGKHGASLHASPVGNLEGSVVCLRSSSCGVAGGRTQASTAQGHASPDLTLHQLQHSRVDHLAIERRIQELQRRIMDQIK